MFCLFLVKANASGVEIRPMQSSIDDIFWMNEERFLIIEIV